MRITGLTAPGRQLDLIADEAVMRRDEWHMHLSKGSHPNALDAAGPPLAHTQSGPSSIRVPSIEVTDAVRASKQRLSVLLLDRERTGRDLHTCILRSLSAIGLTLERPPASTSTALRVRRPPNGKVVAQWESLMSLIQDIQRMMGGLQQGAREEFDLSSELRRLVARYAQACRVQVLLKLQPAAMDILTREEERVILNIVREALSQCVRHVGTTEARIVLQTRGSRIRLTITDNGTGVDPQSPAGGCGLATLAARVRKLGGHLTIHRQNGQGTKVTTEFTLEPILTLL